MSQELNRKIAKGVLWSSVERFSVQIVTFGLGLVIARLLTPSDYGVIAMISVFLALSGAFIDSGFSLALVRKIDRTEADNATAFYFNILVGVLVYIILFVTAPLIASFFDVPLLKQITRVAALSMIFNSFGIVQQAVLTSRMDFKTQSKISLIAALISGITGVAMAYYGFGVWALVAQMLLSSVIRTSMLWLSVKWYPRAAFSKKSFQEMFSFSSKILVSYIITILNQNFHSIVLGKVFSQANLGIYTRANQTAQFPVGNISHVIQRVTFPALSSIQNEDELFNSMFIKLTKVTLWIALLAMTALFVLAEPLVIMLLTEKWSAVIEPLQILTIALSVWPAFSININILTIKGYSSFILYIEVIKALLSLSILLATFQYGLLAVCWGQVAASILSLFVYYYFTKKGISVGIFKQFSVIIPNLIFALVSGLISYVAILYIDGNITKIVVGGLTVLVSYTGLSYIFDRKNFMVLLNMKRFLLSNSKSERAPSDL